MARPSVPQQAAGRGKTILSDHPAGQGTERSASAAQPHGMGGAAASTVAGKLKSVVIEPFFYFRRAFEHCYKLLSLR